MAAYVIVDVDVIDPEPYKAYQQRVQPTLEGYGGRFIVRGGPYETLEGHWQPTKIVILEFPDMDAARKWYASPEYRQILPIRERHARTSFLTMVEGV